MADNIELNSGSGGATIAADDISSVWYQRVKLVDGTADSATDIEAGNGTNGGALRVTLANDSTGIVDLGSNNDVTIDGSAVVLADDAAFTEATTTGVAMFGANGLGAVDSGDAGVLGMSTDRNLFVTLRSGTDEFSLNNNNLDVRIAATSSSNTPFKAEDVASGGADILNIAGVVRDDALAAGAEVSADGDYTFLRVDSTGALWVQNAGALPAGTNAIGKLAANNGVDIGDVDVTSVVPGTAPTNLGKAVDSAAGSTDTGIAALAKRVDTPATITPAANDYAPLLQTSRGHLWVSGAHLEDVAHSSGDPGIQMLAVSAATPTARAGTAGDYQPLSVSSATGRLFTNAVVATHTSGGTSIFRSLDLDETEEAVKATAGQIYWIHAMNLAATARFLKIYNATVATVVVGTTTPVLTFPLATQGDTNGAGFTFSVPMGIAFGTAITVAATTGIADADTGAPGANEVVVNIGYA